MVEKKIGRRQFLRLSAMTAAGAALVACQPQTVIVKETVEVEKEVEKIVKETVEVEKEVTKVVEKEVTKVVEKEGRRGSGCFGAPGADVSGNGPVGRAAAPGGASARIAAG